MVDENKRNVHYFEAGSMVLLYEALEAWQNQHEQRFLSVAIHSDSGSFCCIALTNPIEVVICHGGSPGTATVFRGGELLTARNG